VLDQKLGSKVVSRKLDEKERSEGRVGLRIKLELE